MLKAFLEYIKKESLFLPQQQILLAVSGGMDSVVMVELFRQAGFRFGIAHCHFGLRDQESDTDELFVKALAHHLQVKFFPKRFQTARYASENHLSVQMAARELRYRWFIELLEQEHYDYVATAHHLDDQVETFFINLIRGTGIGGLQGIRPRQGKIIHPMLFTTRLEIERFQSANNLPYCTDSSNLSVKYIRNKIRLQILPLFKEINPDYLQGMSQTIERLREAGAIITEKISGKTDRIIHREGEAVFLSIPELKKLSPLQTFLSELLFPFGFNYITIKKIAESITGISGKQFLSTSHCLLKDRDYLIIQPVRVMKVTPDTEYFIDSSVIQTTYPLTLRLEEFTVTEDYIPTSDPSIAELDRTVVRYPLLLRKWERGDYFQPLGMQGKKKLSDYFIDQKLSMFDKQNTWILESDARIAWIIGHQIDDRFRITDHTRQILRIEWLR